MFYIYIFFIYIIYILLYIFIHIYIFGAYIYNDFKVQTITMRFLRWQVPETGYWQVLGRIPNSVTKEALRPEASAKFIG